MTGAQERALLLSDNNIGTYGSCTRIKMNTKCRLVDNNRFFFKQYVVYKNTVLNKSEYRLPVLFTTSVPVDYMLCSYMESNSVPVADGDTTSAVSPTRRRARPRCVWNAESPTKRLFLL